MKKLFALMLALCLMGSVAMADANLTWDAVKETAEQVDGGFQTFDEIAVKIWMPAVLQAVELTDEDKEAGYIGYYATADESAAVGVMYVDVEGMTLDGVLEAAAAEGMAEPEIVNINGIDAVSYKDEANNAGCIVLVDTNCNMIIFSFTPIEGEAAELAFGVIMSSLMPLE